MSIASQLAPTGTLRVAVWMVPYFARVEGDTLTGIVPDLAQGLAHHGGVKLELVRFENPAQIVAAFRDGTLDATFLGITADRAEAIDFGPVTFEIQTTYLVPVVSTIASIAEIDRAGVRVAVPAKSAQEAHLTKIIRAATLIPVPAENPQQALELLKTGEADAFSHVAPMLAAVQGGLPGARLLPGSYFNVPIAIGLAKGRPAAVSDVARSFVEKAKRAGLVSRAIARHALTGVTVAA